MEYNYLYIKININMSSLNILTSKTIQEMSLQNLTFITNSNKWNPIHIKNSICGMWPVFFCLSLNT